MKKSLKKRLLIGATILMLMWMIFSTKMIAATQNRVTPVVQQPVTDSFVGLSFLNEIIFTQSDTFLDTMQSKIFWKVIIADM